MAPSKKIIFLRHAATHLNQPNFFLGRTSDIGIIPSTPRSLTIRPSLVYSSPLKRCHQTLETFGINQYIDNSLLLEINYGLADGHDFTWLKQNYPNIISAWNKGQDPRYPKGENTTDILKRVTKFLDLLKKTTDQNILVCTHNVWLRCLVGKLSDIPITKWHLLTIPHTQPICVTLSPSGYFSLYPTPKHHPINLLDPINPSL